MRLPCRTRGKVVCCFVVSAPLTFNTLLTTIMTGWPVRAMRVTSSTGFHGNAIFSVYVAFTH